MSFQGLCGRLANASISLLRRVMRSILFLVHFQHGGICGSLEYEVPVIPHSFTKAYVFFDAGRIWGDTQSIHSLSLAGTGLGIKSSIGQNVDANVCLAFPLTRMINYEEQSKTRIHFSITSRF